MFEVEGTRRAGTIKAKQPQALRCRKRSKEGKGGGGEGDRRVPQWTGLDWIGRGRRKRLGYGCRSGGSDSDERQKLGPKIVL